MRKEGEFLLVPEKIELVKQPTPNTCTSACLSMITGIPVDDVIREFHEGWIKHDVRPQEWLRGKGFLCTVNGDVFDGRIKHRAVYLLTVPSINCFGSLHHIVADCRNDNYEMNIFDPAMNEVYTSDNIVSWIIDLVII